MTTSRPISELRRQPGDWLLEGLTIIGLLFLIVVPIACFSSLPETIPTHFDLSGEPDGWGSREMIFILPGVGLVLYVFMTLIGRSPHRYNYLWEITESNASMQYALAVRLMSLIKCEVVWLFAILAWLMIRTAQGERDGIGLAFLPLMIVLLLGTMAWYFIRAQQHR